MQQFELLDRFEILQPLNPKIADLRRSYFDKDLSSIFRIITDENKSDLRKLIMENNVWSLWRVLSTITKTQFVPAFKNFYANKIEVDHDCFSRGQLQSKIWLVEKLNDLDLHLGTVFLCAGWYGTLATMLFESKIPINKIRSFDIDESCVKIAEIFNGPWVADDWRFKALTQNIMDIDYKEHMWEYWSEENQRMSYPITDRPDTIINTSCEHIEDFDKWYAKIPAEKLVILQTNNYFDLPLHINCSKSVGDFSRSTPMSEVLFEGELNLKKYTRFMKIGYK